MSSLVFGLARIRTGNGPWEFLAMPGALLYFVDNELFINSRRIVRDSDYETISVTLREQLLAEEMDLRRVKLSVHRMEEEMLKRLWKMRRTGDLRP